VTKKTDIQTPCFRTYSRRTLYDLPQTLHGGRARRAHHKRCYSFFDLIHSFSARGQNVDFWLLSKNNTGRLSLSAPAGNNTTFSHLQHCAIFPKLCVVIELVETIQKGIIHFLIFPCTLEEKLRVQRIVFPTGCMEKFGLIDGCAVFQ